MKETLYSKESLYEWYVKNRNSANKVINNVKKRTEGKDIIYEGMMHVYIYTAKFLHLPHIVSQQDFPQAFSNYYTIFHGIFDKCTGFSLCHHNLKKKALAYWLLCGNMYEVLESRLAKAAEDAKYREYQYSLENLIVKLIDSSVKNGIKSKEQWINFLEGDAFSKKYIQKAKEIALINNNITNNYISSTKNINSTTYDVNVSNTQTENNSTTILNEAINASYNRDEIGKNKEASPDKNDNQNDWQDKCDIIIVQDGGEKKKVYMPKQLNTVKGLAILNKAIKQGLCDKTYKWLKTKALLSYFAECASDELQLCNAMQNDRKKIAWEPFEILFKCKDLKGCKNQRVNKAGNLPKEYELVDAIFKKNRM